MNQNEREVQYTLQDWLLLIKREKDLTMSFCKLSISITAGYEITGIKGSGGERSQIERYCLKKDEIESELIGVRLKILTYIHAIKTAGLSEVEKEIVDWLQDGRTISDYAKRKGIYISYAYKIKDRAIRKIAKKLRFE